MELENKLSSELFEGTSTCRHGEVRLADGMNDNEGRVEICYNGVWGSVCANGWDQVDTNLACRLLGYYGQGGKLLNHHHFYGSYIDKSILSIT